MAPRASYSWLCFGYQPPTTEFEEVESMMGFSCATELIAHLEKQEKLHLLLIPRIWTRYSKSAHTKTYRAHKPALFPGTPYEYNQYQSLRNDIEFSASPLLMALDRFRRSLTPQEVQLQHVLNQGMVQELHDEGNHTRSTIKKSRDQILQQLQAKEARDEQRHQETQERLNALDRNFSWMKPLDGLAGQELIDQISAQTSYLNARKQAEVRELKRKRQEEKVAKNLEKQNKPAKKQKANKKTHQQEELDAAERLARMDRMIYKMDAKPEPEPVKGEVKAETADVADYFGLDTIVIDDDL